MNSETILMMLNDISRRAHKRGDNRDRKAGRLVRELDELRAQIAAS